MKTDQVQNKGNHSYRSTEPSHQKAEKVAESKKLNTSKEAKKSKKAIVSEGVSKRAKELKELNSSHADAVKKVIGENIEWRQMRFYRNQKDGKAYIDIVNKETGEVIRTVPEPEMQKIATQFKHLSGMTLDING